MSDALNEEENINFYNMFIEFYKFIVTVNVMSSNKSIKSVKKKKFSFTAAIILSIVMLATSVYAEISMRSAYDQLKDSAKTTIKGVSYNFTSYTMTSVITIKDNGKLAGVYNSCQKVDTKNGKRETKSSESNATEIVSQNYNYNDTDINIWYDDYRDTYTVTKHARLLTGKPGIDGEIVMPEYEYRQVMRSDPFEEQQMKDMEKILDALVGNLKDNVNIDLNSDGSKVIFGSLTEMQIPPLVNAVMSMIFKQAQPGSRYYYNEKVELVPAIPGGVINNESDIVQGIGTTGNGKPQIEIPVMVDDLYIKNVTGRSVVKENGIIANILVTGIITGLDKEGKSHDLELELSVEFSDVNTTELSPPDLTGKKIEENTYNDNPIIYSINEKHIGKYARDIVEVIDGRFVKIGQKVIKIAHVDDNSIAGSISTLYFDNSKGDNTEYTFDALKPYNSMNINFTYKIGESAANASITFDVNVPELYFSSQTSIEESQEKTAIINKYDKIGIGINERYVMVFE